VDTEAIQRALPVALETLSSSRLTDAEFIYTPAQIALACFRVSNRSLVDDFLDWRYDTFKSNLPQKPAGEDGETAARLPYGMAKDRLVQILQDIEVMIKEGSGAVDVKKVKEVDKRLKLCTNPEKIPGTAL
jgi:cyclin H